MSATPLLEPNSYDWLPVAFRDTALTVSSLQTRGVPARFDELRLCCLDQVQRLRQELKTQDYPDDVIRDAVYAQIALLDETALTYLQERERNAWEAEPLQVGGFSTHDAGDALIARMRERLQETQPVKPLLSIYHAVLALGFTGRLAQEAPDARTAMLATLAARIGVPAARPGSVVVRVPSRRALSLRMTLPACVLLALVAAGTEWVLLDHWLNRAVTHLLH